MATAPALLRGLSFGRLIHHRRVAFRILAQYRPIWRRHSSSGPEPSRPEENQASAALHKTAETPGVTQRSKFGRMDQPYYRKWRNKEEEILNDVRPIVLLTKEILHSYRYMDGARLTPEDEKAIVEKLLAHHPHCADKIGCGLDSIMVDRHPLFKGTRCLFVVRTDGAWIDFSYQKCIRAYVRKKFPSHAEKFINEHFKRLTDKRSYFGTDRNG